MSDGHVGAGPPKCRNMFDDDGSPKCFDNMFVIWTEPYAQRPVTVRCRTVAALARRVVRVSALARRVAAAYGSAYWL